MTIKRTAVAAALAAGVVGGVLAMAGPAAAAGVAPSGQHENGQHDNGTGEGTAVDPSSNPWHGIIGGDAVTPAGHMWDDPIGTGAVDPSSNPWHGIVGGDSVSPAGHMWDDAIGTGSVDLSSNPWHGIIGGDAADPSGNPWHGAIGGDAVDPSGNPWHDGPGTGTVLGTDGVTYSCAGDVCIGAVPDGTVAPANASGCNHLVCVTVTGNSSGYTVVGRGSGFFGHVDVWGPGLARHGGPETSNPTASGSGRGFGTACAEGWARLSNGSHTSVGLPCVGV